MLPLTTSKCLQGTEGRCVCVCVHAYTARAYAHLFSCLPLHSWAAASWALNCTVQLNN